MPITFATRSGLTVRGQRWGGGRNWVILVHDVGVGQDLDAWDDLPVALAEQGYAVLALDLPGHGLSDDPWEPRHGVAAVEAARDQAAATGSDRLFLVAAGAEAEPCLASADRRPVAGLVLLSPPANAAAEEAARAVAAPKLILVGAADQAALAAAQGLFRRSAGWAALSTFAIAEQGAEILRSDWGAQAREQVLHFLNNYRD